MRENDPNKQVLVVDDEEAIRTGIAQVLSKLNLKVATAAGGLPALEMLARRPYAIVLLDIKMPDLDGVEVLKRLRQDYPGTEVIMITGFPTIQGAVECIKHGALDYLVKPFRIDDLEAVVQKALDHLAQKARKDGGRTGGRPGGHRVHHRRVPGHEKGLCQDPAGRAQRQHRALNRRERHRQGTGGPGHPPPQPPPGQGIRAGGLLRPGGDPAGVRTLRPRQGLLHRGPSDQARPLRTGQSRHLFLR